MEIAGLRSAGEIIAPGETNTGEELGKTQFLELMIAQMNNQDPLDPAKNEDFIAQLAQFSTLEGIENLNSAVADMASALQSSLTMEAAALVGRSVLVQSDHGYLGPAGLSGSIDVAQATAGLTVEITAPSGALVRRIDLGARASGPLRFAWDGRNDVGTASPPGFYRIDAYSLVDGERLPHTVNMPDQVVSVSLGEEGAIANLASGNAVPASQIKEIQ